jgi:hypothetical protein
VITAVAKEGTSAIKAAEEEGVKEDKQEAGGEAMEVDGSEGKKEGGRIRA